MFYRYINKKIEIITFDELLSRLASVVASDIPQEELIPAELLNDSPVNYFMENSEINLDEIPFQ